MTQVRFLGVAIDPLTPEQAVEAVTTQASRAKPFAYVVTPNAQTVVRTRRGADPAATAAFEAAWLSLNDSRILGQISQRLFGLTLPVTTGSDLTEILLRTRIGKDARLTLIGGSDALETRLRSSFGLIHIDRYNPPMGFGADPEEIERCARYVVDHPADYVFLVAGAPQSEIVAHRALQLGGARGVGLCVGSALNFATGLDRRAPLAMRKGGLEWLFRLMRNPRGHAKRVFVESLPVLLVALEARLKGQVPR